MSKVIAARRFALMSSDKDAFSLVNKLIYPAAVRDRFGILNKLSPFDWSDKVDEIPTAFAEDVAIGSIMDEHMAEIMGEHRSGRIVIAWSGGVDSTALICAYLRSGAELDRLTVVCTEDSIEEYPFFFEMMKKQGVDIVITDNVTDELQSIECDLILTGWCADQLFGSDVNTRDTSLYNKPWLDALQVYALKQRRISLAPRSLEVVEAVYSDYAKKLGFPVEQWCEFLWMMNFGCKWTYVQNETNLSLVGSSNYGKAVAFYEDIKFQRWAVSRFPKLRLKNPHTCNVFYKKPLKQYILNYTGDQSYYWTKGKMATRVFQDDELEFVNVLTDDGVKSYRVNSNRGCTGCAYQAVANKFRKVKGEE